MRNSKVTIYVSDNSVQCNKVIKLMNDYDISYKIKNVSEKNQHMKELQALDIYGTPATYIDNQAVILGYQKNKIKYALGMDDFKSHYSSLFEGFKK
ncbi:glutaredoxin family protein [Oceanobacillus rekensis]|uniref:glutaredoxin family protein n=1 Tax=Oceanobacillus rekensis TaxID=937927 RepID=UPI000B43E3B8|nr:glutaredoxin domain-containing protein [Oceanobacillus rekensis]